ncbi:hypothetical protein [Pseudorhodoplanes sp.]|uniref:hypothetical protein n=1 Tax=Pseudorhodoplanes sp. TaxID=1934341 RepID=UPI0039188D9A
MARSAKSSGSQDLIGRISDTIASHPRVSAAAAFQMGVLLGQAMQNAGALKGIGRDIGRKMAEAPGALASSIPSFGWFGGETSGTGNQQKRSAGRRRTAKRAAAKRTTAKRTKRA